MRIVDLLSMIMRCVLKLRICVLFLRSTAAAVATAGVQERQTSRLFGAGSFIFVGSGTFHCRLEGRTGSEKSFSMLVADPTLIACDFQCRIKSAG